MQRIKQVEEDIPIWENKCYRSEPIFLCDGDGPIHNFAADLVSFIVLKAPFFSEIYTMQNLNQMIADELNVKAIQIDAAVILLDEEQQCHLLPATEKSLQVH